MGFRFQHTVNMVPGTGRTGDNSSAAVTIGQHGTHAKLGLPEHGFCYHSALAPSRACQLRLARQRGEQNRAENEIDTIATNLSLDDKGNLLLSDDQGQVLTAAEQRARREQHQALITQWLNEQMAQINNEGDLLLSLHQDTPAPSTPAPAYAPEQYLATPPIAPVIYRPSEAPDEPGLPAQRAWHRHWRYWQRKQQQRYRKARAQWREQTARAEAAQINARQEALTLLSAHRTQVADLRRDADSFHAREEQLARVFSNALRTDEALMSEVLCSELEQLDWPRQTRVDFSLDIDADSLYLDVDLPAIDDLPGRTAKLSANGQRLLIKNKSQKQMRLDYARHIHGLCLRLAGVIFAVLPAIEQVVLSAYSEHDDTDGHDTDSKHYLLSVQINRQSFTELNMTQAEQLDPTLVLEQFTLQRNMTKAGLIRPIEPLTAEVALELSDD